MGRPTTAPMSVDYESEEESEYNPLPDLADEKESDEESEYELSPLQPLTPPSARKSKAGPSGGGASKKKKKAPTAESDEAPPAKKRRQQKAAGKGKRVAAKKRRKFKTLDDIEEYGDKRVVRALDDHAACNFTAMSARSDDQFAQTPLSVFKMLEKTRGWKFDYDPCPGSRPETWNALHGRSRWGKVNFVNPPYNDISKFFDKAREEQLRGNHSMFLIPFRPATNYFWDHLDHIKYIDFIQHKLAFRAYGGKLPVTISYITFKGEGAELPERSREKLEEAGNVYMWRVPYPKTWVACLKEVDSELGLGRIVFMNAGSNELVRARYDTGEPIGKDHRKDWNMIIFQSAPGRMSEWVNDDEKIARAKKSWKHAFGFLIPFQVWTNKWFDGQAKATLVAFANPVLRSDIGASPTFFGSCLVLFCPDDARLERWKKSAGAKQLPAWIDRKDYEQDTKGCRSRFSKLSFEPDAKGDVWRHLPHGVEYKLYDQKYTDQIPHEIYDHIVKKYRETKDKVYREEDFEKEEEYNEALDEQKHYQDQIKMVPKEFRVHFRPMIYKNSKQRRLAEGKQIDWGKDILAWVNKTKKNRRAEGKASKDAFLREKPAEIKAAIARLTQRGKKKEAKSLQNYFDKLMRGGGKAKKGGGKRRSAGGQPQKKPRKISDFFKSAPSKKPSSSPKKPAKR